MLQFTSLLRKQKWLSWKWRRCESLALLFELCVLERSMCSVCLGRGNSWTSSVSKAFNAIKGTSHQNICKDSSLCYTICENHDNPLIQYISLYESIHSYLFKIVYFFSLCIYHCIFGMFKQFCWNFFSHEYFDIGISLYILRFEIICRWVYVVLIMKIIAFSPLHYLKLMPLSDSVWYCIRRFLFIKH